MAQKGLVYTVKDLCRVCYTCVRECPVKAIRLVDGQAEVVILKRGISGSGLGLSIVSKIAELYGGHIQVKSEPDVGSEFKIVLPLT